MIFRKNPRLLCWGLLLAGTSVAPVRQAQEAGKPPPATEARYNAAVKQFDLMWQYYQQSRVESFDVYVWSRLLLDAKRGVSGKQADQVTAFKEHLDRMQKLEVLIKKIRRLGFGRSSDVGASAYYRIEAECWLADARLK
jgi:hypothetical protein